LFSALLTATFAGFIMMTSAYQQELSGLQEREEQRRLFLEQADSIKKKVQQALTDSFKESNPHSCGLDTCIDLDVHFESGKDIIKNDSELVSLARACQDIKSALDTLPQDEKKDIGLVIEGHTDSKPPRHIKDQRARDLFNWNLSALRATSVLYEFSKCNLKDPDYQIVAIGYKDTIADSNCKEPPERCEERNRRTTLRLHADTAQIEERLRRLGH
jgi:flagellar motor protein MotB